MPGSGGAWPGDWTRGREAEQLRLCVDSAQTRGSGSGAPNPSGHGSPVWFLFLRLLFDRAFGSAPHPQVAQSWVLPDSPDFSGSDSDLGEPAGRAPRACSYLNCSEKWSFGLVCEVNVSWKETGR